MNNETPQNQSGIVRLNMGGYKVYITLQSINECGSEYLKALFNGRFSRTIDEKGRIFIDCSHEMARIMHHYMCHHTLLAGTNPDLATEAAEFFCCDGLKLLIDKKVPWSLKKIELNMADYFRIENEMMLNCPLSSHCFSCSTIHIDRSIVVEGLKILCQLISHLINNHSAEIGQVKRVKDSIYCVSFKYRHDRCLETNNVKYNVEFYYYEYRKCSACKKEYKGYFCAHLKEDHNVKVIFEDPSFCYFLGFKQET